MPKPIIHTTSISAEPGWRHVWFWVREGVSAAEATVEDVKFNSEPVVAWLISATIDEEGTPGEYPWVAPLVAFGDTLPNASVMFPDGRVKQGADGGIVDIETAKSDFLAREKTKGRSAP